MYAAPEFKSWIEDAVQKIPASVFGDDVPAIEQLAVLIDDFIYGEPLEEDRRFKQLKPSQDGIWELKTGDLRLFGFFVSLDNFIVVCGAEAAWLKEQQNVRYAECMRNAKDFRDALPLDEPKYVTSGDLRHVIST